MKRLLIALLLLLATPALAMEPIDFSKPLARGMGVTAMGAGVAAGCNATPFVSQATNSNQQTMFDSNKQQLKASDINGKVICKVCVTLGLINTSPFVFTVEFRDAATGLTKYGDTSEQISATTEYTQYCFSTQWGSGTKPTLPNADVDLILTIISGQARMSHGNSDTYQNSTYDWCRDGLSLSIDMVFGLYAYE